MEIFNGSSCDKCLKRNSCRRFQSRQCRYNKISKEFPYEFLSWTFRRTSIPTLLIIKPTRCTNFSNLFSEWNSTCFRKFLFPLSGVFHCTHSNGICHTGLLTACKQDQDGTSWSCSQAVSKIVWYIPLLCVQWKTPDDGQRNCPEHVEFYSENKLEKLVHLVGFIISNLSRCTITWTSNSVLTFRKVCLLYLTLFNP